MLNIIQSKEKYCVFDIGTDKLVCLFYKLKDNKPYILGMDHQKSNGFLTNNEIEWSWSTCAHYCGVFSGTKHIINKEKFRNFISPIPSYWELGNTPFERQFKYKKFLSEPQPQMIVKEIIRCMSRGLPWLKSDVKTP